MSPQHPRRALAAVVTAGLTLVASLVSVPTADAAVTATWVRQIGRSGHAGLYAWGRLYVTDTANERVEVFDVA